jgi:hypothetical protein
MRRSPYLFGVMAAIWGMYLIAESRGQVPKDGPLVFIGLLLILVLIGIGGILDMLHHILKRPE